MFLARGQHKREMKMQNAAGSHSIKTDSTYKRSTADLYVTPFSAVEALMTHAPELASVKTWDASAGLGHIVSHINTLGGNCVGTDLHRHPFPYAEHVTTGIDVFSVEKPMGDVFVVNPPFKDWQRHVEHLLSIGCPGWALLRFNVIAAKRVRPLLPHISEILIVGRQKILPPGVEDKGLNGSIDFTWFHFDVERRTVPLMSRA